MTPVGMPPSHTHRVVTDEQLEIPHRQKLLGFEDGRTRRVANEVLARFVTPVSWPDWPVSWCLPVGALLTDLANLGIAMVEELEQLGNRTASAKIRISHLRADEHDGWPYLLQLRGHSDDTRDSSPL